jgi:hypothetical protein
MSEQPRRFKPAQSIKQRLVERVRRHVEANLLSPGAQREGLQHKTKQADPTARGGSVALAGEDARVERTSSPD